MQQGLTIYNYECGYKNKASKKGEAKYETHETCFSRGLNNASDDNGPRSVWRKFQFKFIKRKLKWFQWFKCFNFIQQHGFDFKW
ncbi:hypothetical protein GCM10010917_34240 [Paenibacillus physcomitrellae]|uniref:Uncharacterized protein n=1 Tax=Paenibacillus physcomitrellae TaxID=1619311 RepID=A0ABQ1GLC6_9BACL|nr:hypothetical protein GCM10010917_34240 [Paenibacillus physcomitrellae]